MKRIFNIAYFSGLLLIPIGLLVMPANFFDTGDSVCISVLFFDQTCYGCGMTRAIQHLIHLDFAGAGEFNKLSFLVLPLLLWLWVQELIRVYKKSKISLKGISNTRESD